MDLADRLRGPDAAWTTDHEGASGSALRVRAGGRTCWAEHGPTAGAEHAHLR
jgi:kanamycin kinase/aminoglycoside 3'-phosphotransferase-2